MVQAPHADGFLDLQPDISKGNLLFQEDSTFPVSHFLASSKGRHKTNMTPSERLIHAGGAAVHVPPKSSV